MPFGTQILNDAGAKQWVVTTDTLQAAFTLTDLQASDAAGTIDSSPDFIHPISGKTNGCFTIGSDSGTIEADLIAAGKVLTIEAATYDYYASPDDDAGEALLLTDPEKHSLTVWGE